MRKKSNQTQYTPESAETGTLRQIKCKSMASLQESKDPSDKIRLGFKNSEKTITELYPQNKQTKVQSSAYPEKKKKKFGQRWMYNRIYKTKGVGKKNGRDKKGFLS